MILVPGREYFVSVLWRSVPAEYLGMGSISLKHVFQEADGTIHLVCGHEIGRKVDRKLTGEEIRAMKRERK